MNGIKNLLSWINENWASLVTIAALVFAIYKKAEKTVIDWKNQSEEEKKAAEAIAIANAKKALGSFILSWVARCEIEWNDKGSELGPIKRADVIDQIYTEYPVLLNVVNQEELLSYIDDLIDEALVTVRERVRKNLSQD